MPILAFSLTDEPADATPPPSPGSVDYWAAAGRAAVFGGQVVARLFAAELQLIPMPVRLGVTGFDFTTARVLDGYNDAYTAAAGIIVREMRLLPARRAELLQAFHANAATVLAAHPTTQTVNHLRVGLIQKFGDTSFRVTNAYNMTNDADDRLVFSRLAQGAPEAYDRRLPALIDFRSVAAAGLPGNMTKYEFALLRPALRTAICLPVFGDPAAWQEPVPGRRPAPLGVVSADSDQDLTQLFNDSAAIEPLAAYSLGLASALQSWENPVSDSLRAKAAAAIKRARRTLAASRRAPPSP